MTDLGRRAVACRVWRWMPGMRGRDDAGRPFRVRLAPTDAKDGLVDFEPDALTWTGMVGQKLRGQNSTPDLTDPATRGCVRALLLDAWAPKGVVFVSVEPGNRCDPTAGTEVCLHHMGACSDFGGGGCDEAEALVLALEAAPVAS